MARTKCRRTHRFLRQIFRHCHECHDQYSGISTEQTVRVWGDTAVITALLWVKGTQDGKPFDYKLWFSDTYVRTSGGWRYAFGQASLPLPKAP
jgi:ketosteroid isomerase-like protein